MGDAVGPRHRAGAHPEAGVWRETHGIVAEEITAARRRLVEPGAPDAAP